MDLKKLSSVGNTINRGVSFIIYGNPGVGKTTLSTTLNPEETLIVNAEAGLGPLLGKGHTVFNVIKAVEDNEFEKVINDFYKTIRTESHPFKNIVLDNLSEIENQLVYHITKRHGKEAPTVREYGDASFVLKQWIHQFRDLVFQNINVVFNAWEFPMDIRNVEGSVITLTCPKLMKSLVPVVCGCVDVIGHMEVHEKTGKRWIRLRPNDQYLCKSQFKGIAGPNDPSGEMPNLNDIINKIKSYDYSKEDE
jgi:phage nucleotide-binding protein